MHIQHRWKWVFVIGFPKFTLATTPSHTAGTPTIIESAYISLQLRTGNLWESWRVQNRVECRRLLTPWCTPVRGQARMLSLREMMAKRILACDEVDMSDENPWNATNVEAALKTWMAQDENMLSKIVRFTSLSEITSLRESWKELGELEYADRNGSLSASE